MELRTYAEKQCGCKLAKISLHVQNVKETQKPKMDTQRGKNNQFKSREGFAYIRRFGQRVKKE